MKRLYKMLVLAMLTLVGTWSADAQKVYEMVGFGEDGYLTDFEPGQQFAIQLAAASTPAVINGDDPEGLLSSVVTEGCIFEFEVANEDEGEYYIKQSSTGRYLYVTGNAQGYAILALTASSRNATTWYVRAGGDPNSSDARERSSGNYPGCWVITSSAWTNQTVYLSGDVGDTAFFYTSTDYNGWYLYSVQEAGGLDKLTSLFNSIFPSGNNDEFEVGDEPGQLPQALFDNLQKAFEDAQQLINESSTDADACEAAAAAIQEAYNAAKAGILPWTEGYYFVVNHVGTNAAMFEKNDGAHFYKGDWEVPEELTEDDLGYVWFFESAGEGEEHKNEFYLRNYVSGNYVGFVASTSSVIPMTSAKQYSYTVQPFPNLKGWVALNGGTYVLHATTNGSDNVQYWDTSHANSAWKLYRIPQEQIDALSGGLDQMRRNEAMQALYNEADQFYKSGFSYDSDATADGDFPTPIDGLVTDVSQLSTNAQEPSEGPIEFLVDGDLTTFFHSAWSVATPEGVVYHNLVADLGEAVNAVTLKYAGRYNVTSNGRPKTMHVYASNDGDTWVDQGYVTFTYPYTANINGNDVDNFVGVTTCGFKDNVAYRYLRLDMEDNYGSARDSSTGNLYFFLGEFRAYKATYNAANSLVEQTDATLRQALVNQLAEAEDALAAGTVTEEQIAALQKAYDEYKAAYPDPNVVAELIANYQAILNAAVEGEELGYYANGSKEAFQSELTAVEATLETLHAKEDIDAARERVEKAYETFCAALNTPEDGKVYFIRSRSEGTYANQFVRAMNSNTQSYVYLGGYDETEGDDANLNDRLDFMWRVTKNADGTFSFRNVAFGTYLKNPSEAAGVYLRQAGMQATDSISFTLTSADVAGAFNIGTVNGYYVNVYTSNPVLTSQNAHAANARFQLTEVDNWTEGYYLDIYPASGEAFKAGVPYALCLPIDISANIYEGRVYSVQGVRTSDAGQTLELKAYGTTETIDAGAPFVLVLDEGFTSVNFMPMFNDLAALPYANTPAKHLGVVGTYSPVHLKAGQGIYDAGKFEIATDEDFSGSNTFYLDNTIKSVTEAGDYSMTIVGTLETDAAAPVVYVADPADGSVVDRLRTLTLTFPEATFVTIASKADLEVKNGEGTVVTTCPGEYLVNTESNQVMVRLAQTITADGAYSITFPAGTFTLPTGPTPEIVLHYYIGDASGITSVDGETQALRIFDLQGRRVQNAQKGIYIISGKKVVR
ncbi:MAG: discoidin domain-containing protein [Bacteroidales bacterium]|nr:discoidin domain-containing protein [Bacteroidales bacterium]MBR1645073.1 discoidin domain-containing protein [Bacteroidales bacterium]